MARTLALSVCRTYGPLEAPPPRNFLMTSGEQIRLLLTVYERDGDATPLNLAGYAAYFSFGSGRGKGKDGVFLPFETGQVYFDLLGSETRYGRGSIPWRVTIGTADEASVVAFGTVSVLGAQGHRFVRDAAIITPGGGNLDSGGGVIGVPTPDSDTGITAATLLWGDDAPLAWESGAPIDYAS